MLGPKVGCGSDRELETSEKNVCFRHVDAKSCQAASGQIGTRVEFRIVPGPNSERAW